jgi:hypothetical protein
MLMISPMSKRIAATRSIEEEQPVTFTRRLLKTFPVILFICCAALAIFSPQSSAARSGLVDEAGDFFESRIRPLLIAGCYDCHADAAQGGLRVDSREALLKGGKRGPAIVAGNAEASLLMQAVRHTHETLRMPKGGARLKETELADLARWLNDGAYWPASVAQAQNNYVIKPEHKAFWSFQPISKPVAPAVKGRTQNAIDAFLLARLEAQKLSFKAPADKRTLLRRATYDLTGLPPTPAEMEAFLADKTPDAFAKVVDRLLSSPHYGERWGRHWLDLARYSDTVGLVDAGRNLQGWFPYAYTYRDWVIRAFNEDLPYDQFLTQQIAADKLPNNDARNLAALGFLSLTRGGLGVTKEEKLDDKIDVVTRGLLGLTVSCARCHNHKFDPLPTQDYYSLHTIFNNTREPKALPLLDAHAAGLEKFAAETKAEEQKIEAEIQQMREKRYPELLALYRTEPEIAKFLRGVYESRALQKEEELTKFAQEQDYNLYLLKRWRAFLQQAGEDAVWLVWQKLAMLPEKEFKEQAAAALSAIDANKINPLVAASFKQTPVSMREAADAYGKLLAAHDKAEVHADVHAEALRQTLRGAQAPVNAPFADYESFRLSTDKQNEDGKRRRLENLFLAQAYRGAPPRAQSVEDAPKLQPGYVYLRGKPENKGEPAPPQFLLILAGEKRQPFTQGSGRLELARAIADKDNPLTARVMVNRIWLHHVGAGLVRTPSDFGARGEAPTHPELLDYLARYFIENGWSMKKIHRLMMLSRAYQQSSLSGANAETARRLDPENKLLWRMNRRRLDFEELRDSLLLASGKLDRAMFGLPASVQAWPFDYRRTIYSFIDRALVPNDLRVFDFPNPEAHSPQRYLTTAPQQALLLLNSPFVIEQAQAIAARPEIAAEKNPRRRIAMLYRLLYARAPSPAESALGLKFVGDPANSGDELATTDAAKCAAWQYGQGEYDEKTQRVRTFKPFAWFLNGEWRNSALPGDPRTPTAFLHSKGGLIYEGKANALVRRWVAPFDGRLSISGSLEQNFENGCRKCEGVQARIVSSRQGEVGFWSAGLDKTATSVAELPVKRGDTVDFVADASKGSPGNGFKWVVTIERIAGANEQWDSARDFRQPGAGALKAWERYAQVLLAAAEFMLID